MNRKNLVLGTILVVLLVLAYLYQGPLQDREEDNNFLSDVDMEEVDTMTITRNGSSTVLTKQGEAKWKVQGEGDFYVEESTAEDLGSKMASLTKTNFELVSTDKDKKGQFRTSEEKGSRVELKRGEDLLAEFIVGSLDSSTLNSTYVSRSDISETYSARNVELTGLMLRDDWRSKVIFDSPKNDITKIRFQYPDREFTVERDKPEEGYAEDDLDLEEGEEEEEQQWRGTDPYEFTVSDDQVEQVVDIMSDLEAARIPAQEFEGTGLSKHLIIIEAGGDDLDNTLMVGEKTDEEGQQELYYAKKGSSDNIYLITGEQRDILDRTMDSLK